MIGGPIPSLHHGCRLGELAPYLSATFGLRSGAPKEPDRRFMRAVETVYAMLDREC